MKAATHRSHRVPACSDLCHAQKVRSEAQVSRHQICSIALKSKNVKTRMPLQHAPHSAIGRLTSQCHDRQPSVDRTWLRRTQRIEEMSSSQPEEDRPDFGADGKERAPAAAFASNRRLHLLVEHDKHISRSSFLRLQIICRFMTHFERHNVVARWGGVQLA